MLDLKIFAYEISLQLDLLDAPIFALRFDVQNLKCEDSDFAKYNQQEILSFKFDAIPASAMIIHSSSPSGVIQYSDILICAC